MTNRFSRLWPWFFFATAFESLIAAIALLQIPSEHGLSASRLVLLAPLVLLVAGAIVLGLRARAMTARLDSFARVPIIIAGALLAWTLSLVLFLLRYVNPEQTLAFYARLSPLLWCVLVVALQTSLFLLLIRRGDNGIQADESVGVLKTSGLVFAGMLAIFAFVAITRIGITPDTGYWGEPGVAVQLWQFILAIEFGLAIFVASQIRGNFDSSTFARFILPILIYAVAVTLWMSVPMRVLQSSFYAPITPPANVPFPYSDAGFYDYLAQSLLIGTRYLGGIPPRPLFVVFLAGLHALLGQNYSAMISAQTLVLAVFPALLYLLGKRIHSSAAGLTAAFVAIFREVVGLWISSNTRVVNSRTFTTDFPTALGIAALCLVVIWWLKKRDLKSTLIAGASLGVLLLLRTQSLFLLPAIVLLALLLALRQRAQWIAASALIVVAAAVTVLPWLVRNHAVSGKFAFDDPNQMAILFNQYSFNGKFDLGLFDPNRDSVPGRMVGFTLAHPAYVANFVAAHFLNTEIGGLLSLPLIERFDGLRAPVNLYWVGWDGSLAWHNALLLLFYLALLALGIGAAWTRARWLGLVPLAFNVAYALANGISRFSSWRYNLPVDWVIYFYICIGAMELLGAAAAVFGAHTKYELDRETASPAVFTLRGLRLSSFAVLIPFIIVGSLPALATAAAAPHFTSTPAALIAKLHADGYSSEELTSFMQQPNAVLMEGRLLYPRMYRRGEGIFSANPWAAYAVQDFARLGFLLINQRQYNAIFITKDVLNFPQAADTILLGCQRDAFIEARIVAFGSASFASAPLTDPCPVK